ncbi:MAG: hypothetical protein WC413_03010 [Candidatus Nanoarchaeia archaeon]
MKKSKKDRGLKIEVGHKFFWNSCRETLKQINVGVMAGATFYLMSKGTFSSYTFILMILFVFLINYLLDSKIAISTGKRKRIPEAIRFKDVS